jgi:macrolide transport system ATP-binding/permease protein
MTLANLYLLNMDVENDFNTLDGSLMSELHIPMHTTDSMSGGVCRFI